MRVVLSLLVVGLAAVSADVTEEQPEVDPEGVAHADKDCSNLFCKDTNDGHAHFLPKLNQETGKCECGSYFTEGPCAGMQCHHKGFLTKEVPANETHPESCVCVNPCVNKFCDAPSVPVIDYTRRIDGWCKCITPLDKHLHHPLPKNATHPWLSQHHLDDDDCSKNTCDTKWGFIAFKPGYVMKDGKNQCLCTPFYKKGSPCFDLTCPDKLLIFENKTSNKCECINPCSRFDIHCPPPLTPMIDYLRETENNCKCVKLPEAYHNFHELAHEEL